MGSAQEPCSAPPAPSPQPWHPQKSPEPPTSTPRARSCRTHAEGPSAALTPASSSAAPGLSSPGPPAGAGSPPQPPAAGPPVPARRRSGPGPSSAPASGGAVGEGMAVTPPPGGQAAVAVPPARFPSIAAGRRAESRELPPPGLTFVSLSSCSCSSSTFLASSPCWGWEHAASLAGTWREPRAQPARTGTAGHGSAPQSSSSMPTPSLGGEALAVFPPRHGGGDEAGSSTVPAPAHRQLLHLLEHQGGFPLQGGLAVSAPADVTGRGKRLGMEGTERGTPSTRLLSSTEP